MQIHHIRGRSLREALSRAAELYGTQAVVLSQETDEEGGVTIAVSADAGALAEFGVLSRGDARRADARRAGEEPGLGDVRRRLGEQGCSKPWIDELAAEISARADRGVHPVDEAAIRIGGKLAVAAAPAARAGTRVIALVGPTGVGKTTTIAKLAHRLSAAGRSVALATLDGYRAGAHEQLCAFAERLEVPCVAPRSGGRLGAELAALGPRDAVLLDTTGRSPRDRAGLDELVRDLGAATAPTAAVGVELLTYLVLACNTSRAGLIGAHRAFAPLGPVGVVLTKLDEAAEPAVALELALRARWPIAFLCDGQSVDRHLVRPTPDRVADLVLMGRMS